MKLLLTAFEPFGGETVNPAQLALEKLNVPDAVRLVLPVEYERAAGLALGAIDRVRPDAVVSIGQAGGRAGITPEKYAVNLRKAAAADNAGRVCGGEPVVPGAPERLESTFGAEAIVRALALAGLPASVSTSAGSFVCNDVMYSVLYRLRGTNVRAGFIHVPFCGEQASGHPGAFTMDLKDIARGLEIAVRAVIAQNP